MILANGSQYLTVCQGSIASGMVRHADSSEVQGLIVVAGRIQYVRPALCDAVSRGENFFPIIYHMIKIG